MFKPKAVRHDCSNIQRSCTIFPIMIKAYPHCAKSVKIRSFFWSVLSYIQSEYGKVRTRKNSVCGNFSRGAFTAYYPVKGPGLLSMYELIVETRI